MTDDFPIFDQIADLVDAILGQPDCTVHEHRSTDECEALAERIARIAVTELEAAGCTCPAMVTATVTPCPREKVVLKVQHMPGCAVWRGELVAVNAKRVDDRSWATWN